MCVIDNVVWRVTVTSVAGETFRVKWPDTIDGTYRFRHEDENLTWLRGWNATNDRCDALLASAALLK